jgi:hypothetical protein
MMMVLPSFSYYLAVQKLVLNVHTIKNPVFNDISICYIEQKGLRRSPFIWFLNNI